MILIFKKIPADTTEKQIEAFVAPSLKGGLFRAAGWVDHISFWAYQIAETNTVEYYALVDIEPDSVGQRVINQLHKTQLNGKYIGIKEYHVRHWSNDKREFQSVVERERNKNKRKTERRRKITKVERKNNEITISTHSNFWDDPNKGKNGKS